jgi:hypothetical protein
MILRSFPKRAGSDLAPRPPRRPEVGAIFLPPIVANPSGVFIPGSQWLDPHEFKPGRGMDRGGPDLRSRAQGQSATKPCQLKVDRRVLVPSSLTFATGPLIG